MEGLPWTLSSRPFGKRKAMAGTKQELLHAWKAAAAGWNGRMRGKAAALLQGSPLRLRPARFGLGAHSPLPRRWPRRAQPQQRPTRLGLGTNPPLPRRWPRRAQPQHRQKARRASRRHGHPRHGAGKAAVVPASARHVCRRSGWTRRIRITLCRDGCGRTFPNEFKKTHGAAMLLCCFFCLGSFLIFELGCF